MSDDPIPNVRPINAIEMTTIRAALQALRDHILKHDPDMVVAEDVIPPGIKIETVMDSLVKLLDHSSLLVLENIKIDDLNNATIQQLTQEQTKKLMLDKVIDPLDMLDDEPNPFEGL